MFTAKDLMKTGLITVDPDDTVAEVVSVLWDSGQSSLPVVDSPDRLLGIVTDFDLLDLVDDPDTADEPVYLHMTRAAQTVEEDTELSEMAQYFHSLRIQQLPVVRGEQIVGMVTRSDVLNCVAQTRLMPHVAVHEIAQPTFHQRGSFALRKTGQHHTDP